MRHWNSNEQFKFIELTHRGRHCEHPHFLCTKKQGTFGCMLSVLFKNHALSANSSNQIKADKHLIYEIYFSHARREIQRFSGAKYSASNFPKTLRHGGHSDLKQSHIILCLEPRREW